VLMGQDKARLPEPPRRLTPQDVAVLRGNADSMALRLACHDTALHRKLAPEGPAARAVFDAVEQSRVESTGSRPMAGTPSNIPAPPPLQHPTAPPVRLVGALPRKHLKVLKLGEQARGGRSQLVQRHLRQECVGYR